MGGRKLLLYILSVITLSSIALFFVFKSAVSRRFAIGVYNLGETPDIKTPRKLWFIDLNRNQPISRDKPVVVWIEGKSAGKTDLNATAYLLSDEGAILAGPMALIPKMNQKGKWVEEATFPAPASLKAGKTLGIMALRLAPQFLPMQAGMIEQTKQVHSQLERVAKVKLLCAKFHGVTEFVSLYLSSEKK